MWNLTSLDLRRQISIYARRQPCFLYTLQNRGLAAEMVRLAHQPEKQARLAKVLEDELGHDLSFAVVRGQIAAIGLGRERFDPSGPDRVRSGLFPLF